MYSKKRVYVGTSYGILPLGRRKKMQSIQAPIHVATRDESESYSLDEFLRENILFNSSIYEVTNTSIVVDELFMDPLAAAASTKEAQVKPQLRWFESSAATEETC